MRRNALLLTFALCAMLCRSASAQKDMGFKEGAGVDFGIVSPEDLDATVGVGVFADVGGITPRVRVEPRIDYWGQSEEAFGAGYSVRDLAVGTRVKYYFPVSNPKLRPFAGGGLGLHIIHAEVEVTDPFSGQTMTAEDSSTKLGLELGGGLASPISPRTSFVATAWYGAVSDFSHVTLKVGLLHAFGS
jgi:hypothetical protein